MPALNRTGSEAPEDSQDLTEHQTTTQAGEQSGGVTIGNVAGGIDGAVIAGRDAIVAFRDVIIYEGTKTVTAGDLLDACQAQVKNVLYDVRHKYTPGMYVNRAIEHEIEKFFDTPLDNTGPNCFLIVAPAGSGKTNLLCDLARRRVAQQPVLLLLGGTLYLDGETGLLGAIQTELETTNPQIQFRSAGDCLHTLQHQAETLRRDALLIIDAINEHENPDNMNKALENLVHITRGRRIKLVITCRDYYWGLFDADFWQDALVNRLQTEEEQVGDEQTGEDFSRFAAQEQEQALALYLKHYQITGRPIGNAAEQCRQPLLLRFFCEAYRQQDVGEVEDIRLKELFDRYWERKLGSIAALMAKQRGQQGVWLGNAELAGTVGDYLLNVAAYMLHHNVRAIPLSEIGKASGKIEQPGDRRSIYGRIRDEFIILEEVERGEGQYQACQVAFVYEEFMEYAMARSLIRHWDRDGLDDNAALAEIETLTAKYGSFAQILGVMVYLSLMFKEQRGLALWPLLLNKGEHWQRVVSETFRKLPERAIDAGVFEALEQMLATESAAVQILVLHTLKLQRIGRTAPPIIVGTVVQLVSDEQEPIARRAALALGNMRAQQAVPALLRAACDTRISVQENAATSLNKLGADALEPFIASLRDDNSSVRRGAAEALERIGDVRVVETLIAALGDDDSNVRQSAVKALERIGDTRAVEPLIAALRDDALYVRRCAVRALGQCGDVAIEPLIAALGDDNSDVRQGAVKALGQCGDAAIEPLIAALRDDNSDVRWGAARALRRIGDTRAVEPLTPVL